MELLRLPEKEKVLIPDEILEQIVMRLPTKYLLRFKCISKLWKSRITSSQFAINHLQLQNQSSKKNKLNMILHGSSGNLQSVNCNFYYKKTKLITHNQPLLNDLIGNKKHTFNIVGSVDGLLLVVATTGVLGGSFLIYIWNPITGEYKTLPQLELESSRANSVFGFGRDPTTSNYDYKVLFFESILDSEYEEFKIHIYTTNTNSWKTLLPNIPFWHPIDCPAGMILAYSNLHYLAEIDVDEDLDIVRQFIISFDLKDDKFRELPLPDAPGLLMGLCALNTHLCAFSEYNGIYSLWRMENFGVNKQECWTKMFSIDDDTVIMDKPIHVISPMHLFEDGLILLAASYKYTSQHIPFIVSYHIVNKKASVSIEVDVPFGSIPVVYEQSLISPNAASTVDEELPLNEIGQYFVVKENAYTLDIN